MCKWNFPLFLLLSYDTHTHNNNTTFIMYQGRRLFSFIFHAPAIPPSRQVIQTLNITLYGTIHFHFTSYYIFFWHFSTISLFSTCIRDKETSFLSIFLSCKKKNHNNTITIIIQVFFFSLILVVCCRRKCFSFFFIVVV